MSYIFHNVSLQAWQLAELRLKQYNKNKNGRNMHFSFNWLEIIVIIKKIIISAFNLSENRSL